MAKVTGLGGAFVRVNDPKALYAWYATHLGVNAEGGFIMFPSGRCASVFARDVFQERLRIISR